MAFDEHSSKADLIGKTEGWQGKLISINFAESLCADLGKLGDRTDFVIVIIIIYNNIVMMMMMILVVNDADDDENDD